MKEITETALTHVLAAHPNAKVIERAGSKVVQIPMYDIDNDRAWIEERMVIKDPDVTPMGILPVFNLRKGAKFDPGGEAKEGPLGQLYRIIGYTPPAKDKPDENG